MVLLLTVVLTAGGEHIHFSEHESILPVYPSATTTVALASASPAAFMAVRV